VTAGENGVGLILLARARAERADQQQQRHLQRRGPAEDLERRRVLEQRGERAHEERIRGGIERHAFDHVVDHDLPGHGSAPAAARP
jgi:hypothetical protein